MLGFLIGFLAYRKITRPIQVSAFVPDSDSFDPNVNPLESKFL